MHRERGRALRVEVGRACAEPHFPTAARGRARRRRRGRRPRRRAPRARRATRCTTPAAPAGFNVPPTGGTLRRAAHFDEAVERCRQLGDDVAVARRARATCASSRRTYATGTRSVTVMRNVPGKLACRHRRARPTATARSRARTAPVSTRSSGAPMSTPRGVDDLLRIDVLHARARGRGRRRAAATRRRGTRVRPTTSATTDEQRDPQPAAAGLALHLDAALADPRIDRRSSSCDLRAEADEVELGFEVDAGARRDDVAAPRARARRRRRPPRPGSATKKFACFSETTAPPIRRPLHPHASMSRPAASPGGLVNTEPAFWPPGWCSRRQRTISSMRVAHRRAGRRRSPRTSRPTTTVRGPIADRR